MPESSAGKKTYLLTKGSQVLPEKPLMR